MNTTLDKRRSGLGGSDIAALAKLNPWKSPFDVYARVMKGEVPHDNQRMKLGRLAEGPIIEDYAQRHGIDPSRIERNVEIIHPTIAHRRGELDGLVRGDHGIEAKLVVSPYQWKLWGDESSDEIPDQYLCQVAWYAMLADVPYMAVVVWINESARDYRYNRNPALEEKLCYIADKFWHDHIEANVPPTPEGASGDSLRLVYPRSDKPLRHATESELEIISKYADARAEREAAEACEDELKAALQAAISDAEGLQYPGGKITWKASKDSEATDWKAVATALKASPELIKQHTTLKPGPRRFVYQPVRKEK